MEEPNSTVQKLRALVEDGPPDLDVKLVGRDPETGERMAYKLTGEDLVEAVNVLDGLASAIGRIGRETHEGRIRRYCRKLVTTKARAKDPDA